MKKVLFGVLMALTIVGCDKEKTIQSQDDSIVIGNGSWTRIGCTIRKFEYEGHEYISITRGSGGVGLCHNPNCHCGKGGN